MFALLWLVLCGWLSACSDRPVGNDASVAASMRDASQTLSASIDAGAVTTAGHPFLAGYLINARDLGGIRVPGPARVAFGRLIRGPLLASLPKSRCDVFPATGVRTVIDLRVPSEIASNPEPACVGEHAEIVLAPFPIPASASAQDYIAMLDERDSISTFFKVLAAPTAYPIYFHCTVGRDRTGVAAALVLLVLGAARQDIVQDYLRSRQTGGVTPEPIEATLDEIERRGGIEAYLGTLGVSSDSLEALRHEVIEPLH